MTVRMSTALRHAAITDYGVGRMVNGGYIAIYSGTQPASADSPALGSLLAVITKDGLPTPAKYGDPGGLKLSSGQLGEIIGSGEWLMTCIADGAPGWWRFVGSDSNLPDQSQDAYRIDGACGESIAGIAPEITAGTVTRIARFSLRFLP